MNQENYQVILVAGGYGKGLRHRTQDKIPKCLLEVGGKTLLYYCLELYLENGFKNFVLLLGHLREKIIEYIESSKYKGKVRYSVEKEMLGKGGAIKYALANNIIQKDKPSIIHYPDDVITEEDFPKNLLNFHEEKRREGAIATAVCVPRIRLRYGIFKRDERSFATHFEEKPWLSQDVNVGVYVVEPEVYKIIDNLIDLGKAPMDFESVVISEICKGGKLACYELDPENWIPFNDEKDFEEGERKIKMLGLEGSY